MAKLQLTDSITFGKYKGKTLSYISKYDSQYLLWLHRQNNTLLSDEIVTLAKINKQELDKYKECDATECDIY